MIGIFIIFCPLLTQTIDPTISKFLSAIHWLSFVSMDRMLISSACRGQIFFAQSQRLIQGRSWKFLCYNFNDFIKTVFNHCPKQKQNNRYIKHPKNAPMLFSTFFARFHVIINRPHAILLHAPHGTTIALAQGEICIVHTIAYCWQCGDDDKEDGFHRATFFFFSVTYFADFSFGLFLFWNNLFFHC